MDAVLEQKVERFRALPRELRLQALLGFAKRFPELPEELREARDRGLGRVEECQTPLYLWIGVEDGRVRIHADAPREARRPSRVRAPYAPRLPRAQALPGRWPASAPPALTRR